MNKELFYTMTSDLVKSEMLSRFYSLSTCNINTRLWHVYDYIHLNN